MCRPSFLMKAEIFNERIMSVQKHTALSEQLNKLSQ